MEQEQPSTTAAQRKARLGIAVLVASVVTVGVGVAVVSGGAGHGAADAAPASRSDSTVAGATGSPTGADAASPGSSSPASATASASASPDGSPSPGATGGSSLLPSPSAPVQGGSTAPAGGTTTTPPSPGNTPANGGEGDLAGPRLKEVAMELVSSFENSTLNWRANYGYIEDIKDGRGYTAGLIGFCSGTGDMLQLVQHYSDMEQGNILSKYLPALNAVNGSASHRGLDPNFVNDWHKAAQDPVFQRAQDDERDRVYFNPAVQQAKADGLGALGQFFYYDAMVMHGPGDDSGSFGGIRAAAMRHARTPAQGGDEKTYLNAYLDARRAAMKADPSHQDTSRVDGVQRVFLNAGNLSLNTPLHWTIYGDPYTVN